MSDGLIRLLLIEDDPDDALLVEEYLADAAEGDRYAVVWVDSLGQGLARLSQGDIDVVLLDLFLPDGQGLEILRQVQAVSSDLPVVVLSGLENTHIAVQAVKQGAQDFVTKNSLTGALLVRVIQYAIQRQELHRQLQASHRQLRAVIEADLDGLLVVDHNGAILFANPAAQVLFSRDEAALVGSPFGLPVTAGEVTELDLPSSLGQLRHVEMRTAPILWAGAAALLVSFYDITERRRLEEFRREAQKMEALGVLAGGIAHNFNNLLASVMGFAELIQMELGDNDPLQKYADKILSSGQRGAELASQLLAYSQKQMVLPQKLDINPTVSRIAAELRAALDPRISIDTELARGLWLVQIDPGQIEQIVLQLVYNSRDAMPAGGRLSIATANTTLDAQAASLHQNTAPGDFVCLTVADTGTGIPAEVRSRIFEPFFTTKGLANATGLGLACVHGIARQNDGFVEFSTQDDRGASFRVYLPRFAE